MEAIKTDLRLLLECLKYQMKWPDSQKQALLTILSICQQNAGQNMEFFAEIGGVSFIYNLSKSSSFCAVKETALFVLASFAELHESCKQTLCKEETFRDLARRLEQEMPLTQKRVAVYMLSVLVANNRRGQTLAKTSRCIETLLHLFRQSFPEPNNSYEQLQLWATVSSALCGCVNNPQNEENQNACMLVFPLVRTWLSEVALPRQELAQPICSFIGMTMANNPCAQEYFVSVGGLDSLSNALNRVLPQSARSAAACKMATVITTTLSVCVSNNELLVSSLSKLRVIPGLLGLLSSPNLNPQDQLAVVLMIGHLTDACVEHQSQLLLAGGLPLMISLLTEASDEEVRKAVMFVLHTCKNITESLGGGVSVKDEEELDMKKHWQSAGEILQRIQQLERKIGGDQMDGDTVSKQHNMPRSASPVECHEEWREGSVMRKVKGHRQVCEGLLTTPTGTQDQPITNQRPYVQQGLVRRHLFRRSEELVRDLSPGQVNEKEKEQMRVNERLSKKRTKRSNEQETRREGGVEEKMKMQSERAVKSLKLMTLANQNSNGYQDDVKCEQHQDFSIPTGGSRDAKSPDIFRHPDSMRRGQHTQTLSDDEISLCSELLDKEIKRFLKPPCTPKTRNLRCAGCMKLFSEVDSRSYGAVLFRCRHQCDFHQVLQKAEDRFRRSQRLERARHTLSHTHSNTHTRNTKHSTCSSSSKEQEGNEREKHRMSHRHRDRFLNLTPLIRQRESKGTVMEKNTVYRSLEETFKDSPSKNSSGRQRERKNWTADELLYLNEGVRRFGHSWNSILWAFPFQPGRTNIDLAKKYHTMQKGKAQSLDQSEAGDI